MKLLAEAVEAQLPNWLAQTVPTAKLPHPGPKGHSDAYLKEVARRYQEALVKAPGAHMEVAGGRASPEPGDRRHRLLDKATDRGFLTREKQRRGPTKDTQRPKRKGSR